MTVRRFGLIALRWYTCPDVVWRPREHLPVRAMLKIVENDTSRFTSGRIVNPGVSQTAILAGRPGGVRAVRHQECHPMCGGPSRTGVVRGRELEAPRSSRYVPAGYSTRHPAGKLPP